MLGNSKAPAHNVQWRSNMNSYKFQTSRKCKSIACVTVVISAVYRFQVADEDED